MSELIKLIAVHRIRLSMKRVVSPDEPFECDPELAEHYLATGSATDTSAKKGGVPATSASDDPEATGDGSGDTELSPDDRAAAIESTLREWLVDDPEQTNDMRWTKVGTPRNKTLDDAVGFNCTTEEVNPIFEKLQGELEDDSTTTEESDS